MKKFLAVGVIMWVGYIFSSDQSADMSYPEIRAHSNNPHEFRGTPASVNINSGALLQATRINVWADAGSTVVLPQKQKDKDLPSVFLEYTAAGAGQKTGGAIVEIATDLISSSLYFLRKKLNLLSREEKAAENLFYAKSIEAAQAKFAHIVTTQQLYNKQLHVLLNSSGISEADREKALRIQEALNKKAFDELLELGESIVGCLPAPPQEAVQQQKSLAVSQTHQGTSLGQENYTYSSPSSFPLFPFPLKKQQSDGQTDSASTPEVAQSASEENSSSENLSKPSFEQTSQESDAQEEQAQQDEEVQPTSEESPSETTASA